MATPLSEIRASGEPTLKSVGYKRANFAGAIIERDQLGSPSTFAQADLTGAILKDATLIGTEYDRETIFPLGFDPIANGMVLIGGSGT